MCPDFIILVSRGILAVPFTTYYWYQIFSYYQCMCWEESEARDKNLMYGTLPCDE